MTVIALRSGVVAALSLAAATGPGARVAVGPTRLVSPTFGYSVVYRTVERGMQVRTTIGLFIYEQGRWRNATPPTLVPDGINVIDDVDFIDPRHGWVAGYDCGRASVFLYRTSNGGRTWRPLGSPAGHSCGGGPTYLSFVDERHGWMEPVSPNGPVGELLRTADGGRTWTRLLTGPASQVRPPALPCLAPIRFISVSDGWMGRCEDGRVFSTNAGGRHWSAVTISIPDRRDARFDLPWFGGRSGVVSAIIGTRAVTFAVSSDGGRTWHARSTRPIAACPRKAYLGSSWPTSIVAARVWWIVAGAARPVAEVTTDAGRTWRTVDARGLPAGCSIVSVTAAGSRSAWAVTREGTDSTALFRTDDGGRDWRRITLER
jgi:photosystem II stability/assembly factor-like uncharacterized protein